MYQVIIALVLIVISAVVQVLTAKAPPKQVVPAPSTLDQFNIPQVAEGTPQTVVFGDVWLQDWMVLWYGELHSTAITVDTDGGKKK